MLNFSLLKALLVSLIVLAPMADAATVVKGHPPIVGQGDDPKVGGCGCG